MTTLKKKNLNSENRKYKTLIPSTRKVFNEGRTRFWQRAKYGKEG